MNKYIIDILPLALLFVFFYGVRPVRPLSAFNENYLSVDTGRYYRGLFALVVIFHHLAQNTASGFFFRHYVSAGKLAVTVFFFLSGYGLQKSYITKQNDYKKNFLLRRLPSVLIPYLIVTVLYWFMYFLEETRYSVKDIILAILKGKPIVSYSWYIINILIFYVAYRLLMTLCKKHYFVMILGGGIWYILYALFCKKMGYGGWWYNASHLLVVGMFWATYETAILKCIKKVYSVLTPLVWLLFAVLFCFAEPIIALAPVTGISHIHLILTELSFVLGILLFSLKFQIGNKVLGFLGDISLELYLTQGLFIYSLRSDFIYIQNELLFCISVLAGTILLSYLLHLLFTPLLKKYNLLLKKVSA